MSKKTDSTGNRQKGLEKLAIGYARVSTAGQGENGISLDVQRAAIEVFADHMGYTLIETYQDAGSGVGEKSFHKREGLKHALDLAARTNADILVWDWDRLTRYSRFHEQLRMVLPDEDRIICIKKSNTMRDASRAAVTAHDEEVAKRIGRATKKGMNRKRDQGAVFGNPMILTDTQPLGVAANSNNADDLVHRIADVLRDLDDPFALTYAELSDILNAKGICTGHGQEWTESRARIPVKKARDLLKKEEQEALLSLPTFGMF